jgi:hypothetical protein
MNPFEMTLQQAQEEIIVLRTERAMMERQFKRMAKRLNAATGKMRAADNLKVAAEARAHDTKEKYRSAQNGLARCERDARRYQWMRKVGLRFVGIASWLHDHEADRRVDNAINEEGRGPSQTERSARRNDINGA